MRIHFFALALATLTTPGYAEDMGLSKITVPSLGATREIIAAVESAIKDEAGVLLLRIEGVRTLGEIVATECPGATQPFVQSFAADVATLNPRLFAGKEVSLAAEVGGDGYGITPLYIPYCLGAFAEKYVVQPGDSLWTIFSEQKQQQNGLQNWENFLLELNRLNGAGSERQTLEPGAVLALPKASWQVPLESERAKTVMQRLERIDLPNRPVINDSPALGRANTGATEQDEESCVDVTELDALKGAEKRLWGLADTLMLNDALDEKHSLLRPKTMVNVAVLDSGISAPRHPTMKRLLLTLTTDKDGFAFPDDPRGFHGTGVFFSAAGGYLLTALNPLGVPMQAAAYNLYESSCAKPGECVFFADPDRLQSAMRKAFDRQTNTAAVNLSVSFTGDNPLPWFTDYLGTDKDVLIVTSAGNDGVQIGDSNKIYPAVYGGREGSNLITVSSVDLGGKLLSKSNFSNEIVDIAAWGCNVPVAEFDATTGGFVRKLRSGTSYAAPQVLFAAAMILRERPRRIGAALSPTEVKIRLMTAVDHSPPLWGKVRHGRILNVAKALSLHTDVVQMKTSDVLLRGRVDFGPGQDEFVSICGSQTIARDEILSINDLGRPPQPGTDKVLIYRRSTVVAGEVETRWCNTFSADVNLIDPFTGQSTMIPTNQISSIILATYPYWEN